MAETETQVVLATRQRGIANAAIEAATAAWEEWVGVNRGSEKMCAALAIIADFNNEMTKDDETRTGYLRFLNPLGLVPAGKPDAMDAKKLMVSSVRYAFGFYVGQERFDSLDANGKAAATKFWNRQTKALRAAVAALPEFSETAVKDYLAEHGISNLAEGRAVERQPKAPALEFSRKVTAGEEEVNQTWEEFTSSEPLATIPAEAVPDGAGQTQMFAAELQEDGSYAIVGMVRVSEQESKVLVYDTLHPEMKTSRRRIRMPKDMLTIAKICAFLIEKDSVPIVRISTVGEKTSINANGMNGEIAMEIPAIEGMHGTYIFHLPNLVDLVSKGGIAFEVVDAPQIDSSSMRYQAARVGNVVETVKALKISEWKASVEEKDKQGGLGMRLNKAVATTSSPTYRLPVAKLDEPEVSFVISDDDRKAIVEMMKKKYEAPKKKTPEEKIEKMYQTIVVKGYSGDKVKIYGLGETARKTTNTKIELDTTGGGKFEPLEFNRRAFLSVLRSLMKYGNIEAEVFGGCLRFTVGNDDGEIMATLYDAVPEFTIMEVDV